jgi:hypothetical protein
MTQAAAVAAYGSNSPSNRNKIINGAMVLDQRNGGAAVTPAGATYLVDRWYTSASDASKLTYQQVADAPAGFKFSIKVTVASSATPSSYNFIWQPIEGLNIIDLGFGAAGAQTISVSFWVKGSVAGNYSVFVGNNGGRSYLGSIPITTSWTQQSVSIPGDTSGTWATTNAAGMYLGFDLGSDASRYSTAGSWLASNVYGVTGNVKLISQTTGSTLNITGVQLEAGSVATPFEYRQYGQELALAQRYYQKPVNTLSNINQGGKAIFIAINTSEAFGSNFFAVTMRAGPTIISYDNAGTSGAVHRLGVGDITGVTADEINASGWSRILKTSGLAAAGVYGALFTAEAEL